MANTFTLTVPDPAASFQAARDALKQHGGSLIGDEKSGAFTGQTPMGAVEGNYSAAGNTVTITITKKPFMVPLSMIQTQIKKAFAAQ
ncbi:MAG TPA: hypothetical protein VKX17_22130 [Planctomycetota bacterium]|nr:hypothetical protein [Planctomycetota bacterium]